MEVGKRIPADDAPLRERDEDDKRDARKEYHPLSMLPQAFTELGIVFRHVGHDRRRHRHGQRPAEAAFGILAVAALRLMPLDTQHPQQLDLDPLQPLYARHTARSGHGRRACRDEDMYRAARTAAEDRGARRIVPFRRRGRRHAARHVANYTARREGRHIRAPRVPARPRCSTCCWGCIRPAAARYLSTACRSRPTTGAHGRIRLVTYHQNVFILDTTLAQNIALADEPDKIDRSRLDRALDAADLRSSSTRCPTARTHA